MIDSFLLGTACGGAIATMFWLHYHRHHYTTADFEARLARGERARQILLRDLGRDEYHRRLSQFRTAMEELDALGVEYDVEDAAAFAAIYEKQTGKRVLGDPTES